MARQMQFLKNEGFDVSTEGGVALVEADSYDYAVKAIFHSGIPGWWNYKDYLISHGVCTSEEFMQILRQGQS